MPKDEDVLQLVSVSIRFLTHFQHTRVHTNLHTHTHTQKTIPPFLSKQINSDSNMTGGLLASVPLGYNTPVHVIISCFECHLKSSYMPSH